MSDHVLWQVLAGIIAVFIPLFGGVAIRRRLTDAKAADSHANLQGARDVLEESLLEKRVDELETDRANWRKTAEEGWQRIEKMRGENQKEREARVAAESKLKHYKTNVRLGVKLMRQHYGQNIPWELIEQIAPDSIPGKLSGPGVPPSGFGDLSG